jgi:TPR repeat protein
MEFGVSPEKLAQALVDRGIKRRDSGDTYGAISDFTAAIHAPLAPTFEIAKALVNRARSEVLIGDNAGALSDFGAAIDLPGAPSFYVACAYIDRGSLKANTDENAGAILDYTVAIELPGVKKDLVAYALRRRGELYETFVKDYEAAFADFLGSADHADAWAQNRVGWCYLNGIGVEKDLAKAEYYFRQSAAQNNETAIANLNIYFPG